jgi:DNA mismatch repair protein MutS2
MPAAPKSSRSPVTTKPLAAAEIPIPDLLAEGTAPRIDVAEARQMLVFAFAMGGSVESFEQMLASAALPASAWDRAHFGRDLFLDELVERCLSLRIGGRVHEPCTAYLLRAISAPPRSREVVAFRRAILAELAEKETLRRDLERSYAALAKLRTLFCAGRYEVRWLRRLDILRAAHEAFAVLAASFADAESGLSRVRAFGEAVRGSQAYERLSALLDHEEHLGTVDLRVRVGSDGELRTFQIVAVRENSDNPFHSSPLGRWIARFKLFLRGFRMNGGEVIERLFDDVFAGIEEPLALAFQLFGDMEFYLAGLGCKALAEERGLSVCLPDLTDPGGDEDTTGWDARGLFNPLLLGEKKTPIACDLRTKHHGSVVVVTGPNSGGKTRLLQAIAITQMLGETGLFVPAASARMPRASGLFVSLVEEARADQPEGQLGMELMRIRRMFEQLDVGSLVLLDELCSGTNPSEGEEIARLVISLLPELDAQVFVTTHLLSFAQHLDEDRPIARLEFLQVELDAHERPTYGFVPGVARTSLAHKTAARLGVTRDELALLIAEKKRGRGESTPVTMGPQAAPNPAPPVAAPRSSKRASAKKVAAAK